MFKVFCFALALMAPAAALAQPQIMSNQWDSAGPERFEHTLQGAAGSRVVRLDAALRSGAPVTVSVYPRNPDGSPGAARLLTASATVQGDSRVAAVTLPGGRLPVVVVVENPSGKRSAGEYTLTVAP